MGGSYLPRNLAALAVDGRLVQIGLMGGESAQCRSAPRAGAAVDDHRLHAPAASVEEKGQIAAALAREVWPLSKRAASSRSSTRRFRLPRLLPRIG